ncbi:MAG: fibrobacter succinogenes major paralogous domain-containing protein [Alistipes sp.]|nr:fibrobacter succinogenes major paralogous domain-containing protein [Alistipes sp.]
MGYIIRLILLLIVLPAVLCRCTADKGELDTLYEGELPVTISLNTPTSRTGATIEGSEVDYEIDRFRVMGFRTGDGSLAFNQPVTFTTVTGTGSATRRQATVNVLTGSFTVVFIANEQLDTSLSAQLDALQPDASGIGDLKALSFELASLDWESGNTNLVPMSEVCERVLITGNNRLSYDGLSIDGEEWPVTITRMAVRVGLTLRLTDTQLADFQYVKFDNVPDKLYIFPETDNSSSTRDDLRFAAAPNNGQYMLNPGNIVTPSAEAGFAADIAYPRIILPESWFSPENVKDNAVSLSAVIDGTDYPAVIGCDIPDDYTLPRNFYYDIAAKIAESTVDLEISLEATPWDDEERDGLSGNKSLNVSAIKASINERNMARIFFWTDQPEVYIEDLDGSDQPVDEVFYGLTGSNPANFHFDSSTGEGWFDIMTDRDATRVDAGSTQTHKIYLNAGGGKFSREITVSVDIPSSNFAPYDYVGAFWRNDQKGERVIAMAGSGAWTATVDGSADWVVLAPGKSLDANLWVDGTEPGDPENYPVEGSATTVSGTGNIYFRIGLTGPNPDPATPRYAKVVVNGTHEIFIRQGEAADYLMRPEDGTGNGTLTDRPLAAKFAPYNLTATEYIDGVTSDYIDLDVRGATFTRFPTQTGAYFQWGSPSINSRYAWNPYLSTVAEWTNYYPSDYWSAISEAVEVCPEGYRRPEDGTTSAIDTDNAAANSEIRQSLNLNPADGYQSYLYDNNVYGYYADGFFDRRPLQTPSGTIPVAYSATSVSGSDIALIGQLFFNPDNNASLFFPASGYRDPSYSTIMAPGMNGNYWTSTTGVANGYSTRVALVTNNSSGMFMNVVTNQGLPIRCVVGNYKGGVVDPFIWVSDDQTAEERILAETDALSDGVTGNEQMNWATAMGINTTYNTNYFFFSGYSDGYVALDDNHYMNKWYSYGIAGHTDAGTGCAAYWEGDPDDVVTGKGMWFLPTRQELYSVYEHLEHLQGPEEAPDNLEGYWSSMESSAYEAYAGLAISWDNASIQSKTATSRTNHTRCVRYPTPEELEVHNLLKN